MLKFEESINIFDHDWVEVLKADFTVSIRVSFLNHESKSLDIQVFFNMTVHLFQIFKS